MTTNTLSTRRATLEDVENIALLFDAYRQFYEQAANLPLATEFIRQRIEKDESIIFIAEDEHHQMLGFCQLYPSFCSVAAAPIFVLYDLFVRTDARKSGSGRMLLSTAERHARQSGCVRMDLTTARTNLPAQSLYESMGWVRDDVFYAYSRDTRNEPEIQGS